MGKAIIVPGADFSGLGMGKVNFSGTINAPKVIVGQTYTLIATMPDATWDIDDDTYADINSSTGVLTIKSGAWGNEVTVTATSGSASASATIKVFYNTVESETFEEVAIVDVSDGIINGSIGNPGNTFRVSVDTTIAIGNYTKILVSTTKSPASGYTLYYATNLYTVVGGSPTRNGNQATLNDYQICEYYKEDSLLSLDKFTPLYEDAQFPNYTAKSLTGSTPLSFCITFDESNNGTYDGHRALRYGDFTNCITKIALFK